MSPGILAIRNVFAIVGAFFALATALPNAVPSAEATICPLREGPCAGVYGNTCVGAYNVGATSGGICGGGENDAVAAWCVNDHSDGDVYYCIGVSNDGCVGMWDTDGC